MKAERFTAHWNDNVLTIQEAAYIEDGWYIEIVGDTYSLYEISQYGGNEWLVGKYNNFKEALKKARSLT